MTKPKLLTHRILEESAGEWRFTYTVPLEGTSSYTYRSQVFNTRLEALTGMMELLTDLTDEAALREFYHEHPGLLPDSMQVRALKLTLEEARRQWEAADAAD